MDHAIAMDRIAALQRRKLDALYRKKEFEGDIDTMNHMANYEGSAR